MTGMFEFEKLKSKMETVNGNENSSKEVLETTPLYLKKRSGEGENCDNRIDGNDMIGRFSELVVPLHLQFPRRTILPFCRYFSLSVSVKSDSGSVVCSLLIECSHFLPNPWLTRLLRCDHKIRELAREKADQRLHAACGRSKETGQDGQRLVLA